VVVIGGQRFFLWRAAGSEGEVLDLLLQRRRDKAAAVTYLRKLLKNQGYAPDVMVRTAALLWRRQGADRVTFCPPGPLARMKVTAISASSRAILSVMAIMAVPRSFAFGARSTLSRRPRRNID
jgi:hypothetical protein